MLENFALEKFCFCCLGKFRGNLNFPDYFQKEFYNVNHMFRKSQFYVKIEHTR